MIGDPIEARQVPVIDARLAAQLREVPPSVDRGGWSFEYRPCRVKLDTGEWRDRVYVQEATSYISKWGVWPWEDRAKRYVPLDNVVEIKNSPTRLRPELVEKVYAAGESGMGYSIFTLVTSAGRRIACLTGGAADWVELPADLTPDDIVDVVTHEGREEQTRGNAIDGATYAWCLYRVSS